MHGVGKERWWSRNPCALVAVNNNPGRGEPCRRQGVFAVRSFIEFLLSLSLSLASLYTYIFFALRALNVGNDSRISLSLSLPLSHRGVTMSRKNSAFEGRRSQPFKRSTFGGES